MLITTNGLVESRVFEPANVGRNNIRFGLDTSLFGDEAGEAVEITALFVICRLFALAVEPLQGREALNSKSASEILVFVRVDFRNRYLRFRILEVRGELFVDGR